MLMEADFAEISRAFAFREGVRRWKCLFYQQISEYEVALSPQ